MKKRLDVFCVEKGIFDTMQRAQAAIMAGLVLINGIKAEKAGQPVREEDKVEKAGIDCPYVSRGGLKLKAAIDYFSVNLKNKICLDIGVATGGFSDCMLQEGALKVYGVDVGEGRLHEKIFSNQKFVFLNNTNARFLKKDIFSDELDFAAVDVSFISLKLILPPLISVLKSGAEAILLVKPQFELSKEFLSKGIVKKEEYRINAMKTIENFIKKNIESCVSQGYIDCPIKGVHGNREFLFKITKK